MSDSVVLVFTGEDIGTSEVDVIGPPVEVYEFWYDKDADDEGQREQAEYQIEIFTDLIQRFPEVPHLTNYLTDAQDWLAALDRYEEVYRQSEEAHRQKRLEEARKVLREAGETA